MSKETRISLVAMIILMLVMMLTTMSAKAQDLSCDYQTEFLVEYERQAGVLVNGLYDGVQAGDFSEVSLYSGLLSIGAVLTREYVNCPDLLERLELYEKFAYWGLLVVSINNDRNLLRGINSAPEADIIEGIANEMAEAYALLILVPPLGQRS